PVGSATAGVAATPFHPVGGMHQVAATLPPGSSSTPATGPASVRPATVRVGPGDTLESLAQRFYGDAAMAGRLWEANRDRIRSPGLIVPGMELRLP
ncbi:MAG: LysM domain-containing protein, partial [Planctomycetia bacterium]|nr:LysM domain-containing protein [Planctomycetia bacterium]